MAKIATVPTHPMAAAIAAAFAVQTGGEIELDDPRIPAAADRYADMFSDMVEQGGDPAAAREAALAAAAGEIA